MLTANARLGMSRPAAKNLIGTMELFKGISAPALQDIERRMFERKFAKGESIFLEGDPAEFVWFVKEGHVKALAHATSGRCQTLCMVGPGNMFGTCCSLGGGGYSCHGVAETDVTIVSLLMTDFTSLLARYPEVSKALIAHISQRLRRSKDTQTFEHENVEKRILHVLTNLVKEFGNTIPLTRREIAEMAGTTVETSIRTFSRLEGEGLVSTTRGRITVRSTQDLSDRMEAE